MNALTLAATRRRSQVVILTGPSIRPKFPTLAARLARAMRAISAGAWLTAAGLTAMLTGTVGAVAWQICESTAALVAMIAGALIGSGAMFAAAATKGGVR